MTPSETPAIRFSSLMVDPRTIIKASRCGANVVVVREGRKTITLGTFEDVATYERLAGSPIPIPPDIKGVVWVSDAARSEFNRAKVFTSSLPDVAMKKPRVSRIKRREIVARVEASGMTPYRFFTLNHRLLREEGVDITATTLCRWCKEKHAPIPDKSNIIPFPQR